MQVENEFYAYLQYIGDAFQPFKGPSGLFRAPIQILIFLYYNLHLRLEIT